MLRKLIAVDTAYADRVSRDAGLGYFPAGEFRQRLDSAQGVLLIEAVATVVEPVPRSDAAEDIAAVKQNVTRKRHALEEGGYRVIVCPAKPSAGSPSGFKHSDDQRLMLATLALAMRLRVDFVVLVAADGDYAPLVWQLRDEGIRTHVVARPDTLAADLRRAAYSVQDMSAALADIRGTPSR